MGKHQRCISQYTKYHLTQVQFRQNLFINRYLRATRHNPPCHIRMPRKPTVQHKICIRTLVATRMDSMLHLVETRAALQRSAMGLYHRPAHPK